MLRTQRDADKALSICFFTIISTSHKTILLERDTLMREALFVFLEIDNGILTDQIATLPSIGLKYPSLPMHSP